MFPDLGFISTLVKLLAPHQLERAVRVHQIRHHFCFSIPAQELRAIMCLPTHSICFQIPQRKCFKWKPTWFSCTCYGQNNYFALGLPLQAILRWMGEALWNCSLINHQSQLVRSGFCPARSCREAKNPEFFALSHFWNLIISSILFSERLTIPKLVSFCFPRISSPF